MSDFVLEAGTEYGVSQDDGFTSQADAAFDLVDNGMTEGVKFPWNKAVSMFFDMVEPGNRDKAIWIMYVQARNAMLGAINARAITRSKPWRLYVSEPGVSIIKLQRREMVEKEIISRMRRVGGAYKLIVKKLQPILRIKDLTKRDRKILNQMLNIATGATLATSGMIGRLDIPKKIKKELLLQLPLDIADDEEDDET